MLNKNQPPSKQGEILKTILLLVVGAVVGSIIQLALAPLLPPLPFGIAYGVLIALIFVSLLIIGFMVRILMLYIEYLRSRFDITIKYLDRHNDGQSNLFREATKVIKRSKRRILVLNSFIPEIEAPEGTDEETKLARRERNNYYDALLESAIKRGVVYERILQIEEGMTVEDLVSNTSYTDHFHKIFDTLDNITGLPIGLLKARAQRLTTFVLIDDVYLLWQINELVSVSPRQMQMHGIFVIEDHRGEIIPAFEAFFDTMKRNVLGAVQRNELPPKKSNT